MLIDVLSNQSSTETCNIEVDSDVNASHLYLNHGAGDIRVIADPGGFPSALGAVNPLGFGSGAMTYDKIDHALYFFQTETDPAGRVMKLQ